ncbi:MAG: tRNA pseudouridine(38-40) synthase TruA [Cellvibrio sp.]|nr:tRNA pseudouridine(38-40) synthase TruA [Cellvibrio sp.]
MSQNYIPDHKPYERNGEILQTTPWPEGMTRVALGVEYKGTEFHGFQTQPSGVKTVQQALQKALSTVADEEITLVCAGRTDAGVHATQQVIHFDTSSIRPEKAWILGTKPHLPDSVIVRWAKNVSPQFHARFSALNRTYRYLLSDASTASALVAHQVTWSSRKLNLDLMREGAKHLIGEQDFTSFRATQCQAKSPVRTIHHLHLVRRGDLIIMEVQANAFLHHMVRNIVGVLMTVGTGDKPVEWVAELLAARDRSKGAVTAKPYGLYLVSVDYPEEFKIPKLSPRFFIEQGIGELI